MYNTSCQAHNGFRVAWYPFLMEGISRQYNQFSGMYSENREDNDFLGDQRFYEVLGTIDLHGKRILDIGCGDGSDLAKYAQLGTAEEYGVDPSEEFAKAARDKNPRAEIIIGNGENLPFKDASVDIVVSKYAFQTSPNVPEMLRETARVLKPEGYFILLSKHPLRQFLEKIKTLDGKEVDYFKQNIVDSFIYGGKIHLREPSHTMSEYISSEVLDNFDLQEFIEDADFPASERIDGHQYPTFFVAKYKRRKPKE